MHKRTISLLFAVLCPLLCFQVNAQFRNTNTGNSIGNMAAPPGAQTTSTTNTDGAEVPVDSLNGFSFKAFWRGYTRQDTLRPGYFFLGGLLVPGLEQVYNRDWWKIPVIYAGIGAGVGAGLHFNQLYQETGESRYKTYRMLGYAGAGLVYWGSLLDGVVCYETDFRKPVPGKSTLYSALLPGLGQAYNGDWWKIPIWVGGLTACGYFLHLNNMQYQRFKYIYIMASDPKSGYTGGITQNQAEWYKDIYRRYRDYSVISIIAVYALNIIDANVFAYMADFEVNDNLADARLNIEPAVISPIMPNLAANTMMPPSFGLQMRLEF